MKYLVIYWIWVDCTISITIEKFDSCDFIKKLLDKFLIQMSLNVLEKKDLFEKLLSFERWKESCWKPLYQNPFYMFIIFFNEGAHPTPKCAFTPNSKEAQKKFLGCLASILQFVTSCYSKSPMEFHQLKFVPY
jgi:hypothetical protein